MAVTPPKRRRPILHKFQDNKVVTKSHPMAPVQKYQLKQLLQSNVMRLKYTKRDGTTRFMWCTASRNILDTYEAANLYKFIKPTGKLPYDIDETDNIIVWDLEKCAWRTVNATRARISIAIPDNIFIERMKTAEQNQEYFDSTNHLLYGDKSHVNGNWRQSDINRLFDLMIQDKTSGSKGEI